MRTDTYKVVLSEKTTRNQNIQGVKHRLAALFNTSLPVIESLFSRDKAVIKRNLDLATANRYARAIEKAGAACYVEKMTRTAEKNGPAAPRVSPGQRDKPPEDPPRPAGNGIRVIPVQTAREAESRFFPRPVKKLSASPGGLSFNTGSLSDVPFSRIAALAAYRPAENGGGPLRLLVFLAGMEPPLSVDSSGISYSSFHKSPPQKPASAFRGFLHLLCQENKNMILEEGTFDFLSGAPLPRFDAPQALKYATTVGRLVESGSKWEEG